MADDTTNEKPVLRIVRGTPDAAELAALVAVLGARSGGGVAVDEPLTSGWRDRGAGLRPTLAHGPGAWVRSARAR